MTTPTWVFGDVDVQGDSAQNVIGTTVNGDLVQRLTTYVRGIPSMYLGSDEITDRIDAYVPAANHDPIVRALEFDGAVVLAGPRGCGRETTAIAAIRQLQPGVRIRRFSLEDEDSGELRAAREGYLVHATDCRLERLGSCVDAVRASGGYLVVIADEGSVPGAAFLPTIAVVPPHPVHVYQRQIDRRGLTEWRDWGEAATLLDHASPADARRLADIIEDITKRGSDLTTQRREVTSAYRGWRDELHDWFEAHRRPDEQALLLAAAVLSPADETSVYTIASSLARQLEITMNGAGLAWCPRSHLRELLNAEHDGDRIVFRRYGFAESALRHTLAEYPNARSDVLAWLASLPTDEAVSQAMRTSLAETFADLAAEHGAADLIIVTARKWAEQDLADLAFITLSRTCLHSHVGGRVRTALYRWSRTASAHQTLKLVIARVCEPLGQTYPSIALTRLKHLATRGNAQVRGEVVKTAVSLYAWGHRTEILQTSLTWCTAASRQDHARQRRTGAMIFLELARPTAGPHLPELLTGEPTIEPMQCVRGWRAALSDHVNTRSTALEEVAHKWLDTALDHPRLRIPITRMFVKAAGPAEAASRAAYGTATTVRDPTMATLVINIVEQWAAQDRTDETRRQIQEAIVIPLTHPWWRRLLKILHIGLRTLRAPTPPVR